MKSLVEKIHESLVNEAKKKTVNTTVGEYAAWWFGVETFDEIDPMDDFESSEFDLESLDKVFKGKYSAQYEFLADHKDIKITVAQKEVSYNDEDVQAEFTVGKVTFKPISTGFFEG